VAPLVPGLEAEDLGPLTAADVTDLNPAPAAAPTRQPILTNVPDARTAAQIAESQRIEEARQAKEAEMRMLDAKARGMPLIPDSPMGSRDILDWANENPIYLPPGFSEDRKLPEYESLKRNPLPNYWRQFVASAKQGGNPDSVAQRAFDAGLIPEPSADAYFAAVQDGIAARKQYRVQFQARDKALAQEEKRVVDFEKSQTKLAKKPAAQEVPFDEIVPGDRMTIDGEKAVVKNVEYNEDGYLTNVVIEDGKRFGLMQFDAQNRGGILVDEFKPQPRQTVEDFATDAATATTTPPATSAATTPAPASRATSGQASGGQTIGETSGGALLDVAPSTRPRNRGETAAPQRADVLAELGAATREGAANQAQGRFGLGTGLNPSGMTAGYVNADIVNEAVDLVVRGVQNAAAFAAAMVQRFGEAIREFLDGLWQYAQRQVQDRTVTFAGKSFVLPAPTKQGFFAGPSAQIPQFMRDSLKTAQSMAAAGKNGEEIRAVTGWFPGKYDKKMRWEIPDDGAKLNWLAPVQDYTHHSVYTAPLGDVLSHPSLFEAYPEARNIIVEFNPHINSLGNFQKASGSVPDIIQVKTDVNLEREAQRRSNNNWRQWAADDYKSGDFKTLEEALAWHKKSNEMDVGGSSLSTILHEVQHWIQNKEGLAKGSNPKRFETQVGLPRHIINLAVDIAQSAVVYKMPVSQIRANPPKRLQFLPDEAWFLAENRSVKELLKEQEFSNRSANPEDAYRRTAGEIEARDIQARQFLTAEQRKATAPYSSENIAPEDAIVLFDSAGPQSFIPNPLHKQGEAFRVKAQVGRALLTGSPLPKDFTKVLDATDNERRAVDQTAAIVGRDLAAAVKAHAKRTGKPLADVWAMVEPAMTGQPGGLAVLNALDANLGERTRRARNVLDDLSAAVARTMPAGEMRNTILGNLGQWMRRGYAAFDPESGWSFDKVTAAAKAGKLIGGKDASKILADARAHLRAQNPGATAAEIEADMRDLMDRDTWQSALLGGTVKKAVGSLMRRKDIAPEIRALMGEETNPLHRYLQSAKFQAQLIARHHGQVAMRTIGLATGLLKATRGGVYTVEIPKEGYRWSGLGGTFTTPELMQALENSSGILQDGNTWGGWLVKTLKVLGNEAKLNRVAMNPDSWLVNVIGGFMSLVQSGDVFATSIVRRLREAGGTIGSSRTAATANALQDAQRALLARLTEQGVIGSSITLADIEASLPRHLLQWVAENEARDRALGAVQGALIGQSIGRGAGVTGRAIGGALGAVGGAVAGTQNLQKWRQKVAEWTMTKPDNLFRVTGWLTNYETALAAGMQPDAAAKWASERTLNTFPNYNALPAVLREFSKLGLVGSFIAFTHEVYRNTYWNIRYALREIGSGNQALQVRGLQRLAGLTSIAALTFGGGLASILGMSGAAGADDERNKMFRKWFAAPWERDAVLAFDKFTPESVSYLNTSYLLPQVTLQELAQAAGEGLSEGEAVQRVLGRVWEQFAGSSVHLSPIINAALNVDRNGRPITNRPGLAGVLERVDSAVATIGEPGFAEKITRIIYALEGAKRRGRMFSVEQEVKRLFGLRGYERTWDTLVKGRYSKFGAEYRAIRDDANRMLGENLPGAQVKAVEEANARIAELDAQRVQFEQDMQRLGIAPMIVRSAQKESAFNKLNPVRLRADGERVEAVTVRR
jgi:hypothetical protein